MFLEFSHFSVGIKCIMVYYMFYLFFFLRADRFSFIILWFLYFFSTCLLFLRNCCFMLFELLSTFSMSLNFSGEATLFHCVLKYLNIFMGLRKHKDFPSCHFLLFVHLNFWKYNDTVLNEKKLFKKHTHSVEFHS